MDTFFRSLQFIKHRVQSHRNGHWIHSPFVFHLANKVLPANHPYYAFKDLANMRHELKASKQRIRVQDHGAGSHKLGATRTVGQIARTSAMDRRYGEMLFRLVNHIKPCNIVELGTSIGLGTTYLAMPNSQTPVHTIEACPQTAEVARITHELLGITNINRHVGTFEDELPGILEELQTVGLVFFDGNHRKEPTLRYFEQCLPHVNEHTVFVFDDIYWSKDMAEAWTQIKAQPEVMISIDLYRMGLVFFRKGILKQDFRLRV